MNIDNYFVCLIVSSLSTSEVFEICEWFLVHYKIRYKNIVDFVQENQSYALKQWRYNLKIKNDYKLWLLDKIRHFVLIYLILNIPVCDVHNIISQTVLTIWVL